jgi:hypothetical protein
LIAAIQQTHEVAKLIIEFAKQGQRDLSGCALWHCSDWQSKPSAPVREHNRSEPRQVVARLENGAEREAENVGTNHAPTRRHS